MKPSIKTHVIQEDIKMKKIIAVALTAIIVTASIAFACFADSAKKNVKTRQTATAYLDQEGNTVTAKMDLTGGYSCDFARGAVYLYDQEDKEGVPCVAMGITLDEEVYNDHMKAAKEAKDCTEYKGGVMYTEEGHMRYLCRIGEKAYFSVFAEKANQKQMKALVDRFNVTPDN